MAGLVVCADAIVGTVAAIAAVTIPVVSNQIIALLCPEGYSCASHAYPQFPQHQLRQNRIAQGGEGTGFGNGLIPHTQTGA